MRVAGHREERCLHYAAHYTKLAKSDLRIRRRAGQYFARCWDAVDERLMRDAACLANRWSVALEVER